MPLRELQDGIMNALLGASLEPALELMATRATAEQRLSVYRNNTRANFLASLRSSFPAIWRLVGEDYFRYIAKQFQTRHPSRSGDLLHIGRPFPDYLAQLHRADEYAYLGDVARLEWLCQEALLAADHAPLDLQKLQTVAPSDYDTLCFELHPTLRLYASRYPALRIWETNVGTTEPEIIDLGSGSDCLALMRYRLELKFYRLSHGEHCFLQALQQGENFATALQSGGDDAAFDAGAALRRFAAAAAIVDCHSTYRTARVPRP
jgi:hypothetical protein